MEKYDFSGWATKANLKCSDGRTIMKDAFKHNDGARVPLVWNHQHNDPLNVLGHAMLSNRDEGVYAYCTFNDTESGRAAKELVEHKDVVSLSIYANQLKQNGGAVLHGDIKEVSLVLAGANPGAFIDSIIAHGEESDVDAIIYTGEDIALSIAHAQKDDEEEDNAGGEKTVEEVIATLNDEQYDVVCALIAQAAQEAAESEEDQNENETTEGDNTMKHNLFSDVNESQEQGNVLSHSQMKAIIDDGKRYGSMKESFLQHAAEYGIDHLEYLFPDDRAISTTPEFIKRDTGWVQKVMGSVHHTPFSRIKSIFADITEDDARAKGYIKGKLKKEEVFSLLKRTTSPTTIYKKQKMDRDDIVDITDFDVLAWLKSEMRLMLDEEIARAILIGDGRLASSDDKINEDCIRPVWTDADLYTVKVLVDAPTTADTDTKAKAFINSVIRSRKNYKGSGNPTMYCTEDMVTDCLLLEDQIGHKLYKSVAELATTLRVKEIVTVPVMEGLSRKDAKGNTLDLMGLIVNLNDYNVGADKGGAINMFDDFDIDYNQQKYLIETRCSGAMVKPYGAIAIEFQSATV